MIPCSGLVPDAAHRGERSPTLEHEREIDPWLKRAIRRERRTRFYGDRYGDVLLIDQRNDFLLTVGSTPVEVERLFPTDHTFETNNPNSMLARRALAVDPLDPAATPERAAITREST